MSAEHEIEKPQCGDRWNEMSCTLPTGHSGMHVDERVFGPAGAIDAATLRLAAAALEAQPPKLRRQYVAALRLYADEPWRLLKPPGAPS